MDNKVWVCRNFEEGNVTLFDNPTKAYDFLVSYFTDLAYLKVISESQKDEIVTQLNSSFLKNQSSFGVAWECQVDEQEVR